MSEKRKNMTASTGDSELDNNVLKAEDAQMINLVVKNWNGDNEPLRLNKNAPPKKLITAYCQKMSVDITAYHFLFDRKTIKPHQTPKMLEMEDGDQIDAMLPQTGGGGRAGLKPPLSSVLRFQ